MSLLAAELITRIAADASVMYELLGWVRNGRVDLALPAVPSVPKSVGGVEGWHVYYRNHRRLLQDLEAGMPDLRQAVPRRLLATTGHVQAALDAARAVSLWVQTPDGVRDFKALIRKSMTPFEWCQYLHAHHATSRRNFGRHLWQLDAELRDGAEAPWAGGFEDALRCNGAAYFFVRVQLVMLLRYQTTPIAELRALQSSKDETRRLEAAERLVRVDPLAGELGTVRQWWNVDSGLIRRERRKCMGQWQRERIGHGKFWTRRQFKASLGGLVQVVVDRIGAYLDLSNGQLVPTSMSASDVRGLFDAVEKHRKPRGRARQITVDPDLTGLGDDGWRKLLRQHRKRWDQLFEHPGRRNLG
jgi:hypothetical protein